MRKPGKGALLERAPATSSARVAAARVDGAAVHAEHVLAGAQRAAAEHAQPSPCDASAHVVCVSDQCCCGRVRPRACVGHWRRRRRRVAGRSITRMCRVASGCLSHGCCRVGVRPVVVSAAQDAGRVTGDTRTIRADRTRLARARFGDDQRFMRHRRHWPRLVSGLSRPDTRIIQGSLAGFDPMTSGAARHWRGKGPSGASLTAAGVGPARRAGGCAAPEEPKRTIRYARIGPWPSCDEVSRQRADDHRCRIARTRAGPLPARAAVPDDLSPCATVRAR
jgi:hypothetical protein